eukprot:XP_019924271.1 PREDICTED: complement C1q-like protein 3 [Crassostrea gigas]
MSLELSFLRGEVDDLRKTNKGLVDEITRCNRSLETVETKYQQVTSLMHDLAITMYSMNPSLYRQAQQTSDIHRQVAFTAGIAQNVLGDESRTDIIYRDVITNLGGGYNPTNGVFTAPVSGTYVFFTTVVSWDDGNISTDIVLNGNSKVRTFADSRGFHTPEQYVYQTGTNLVSLHLQVGDRVWVRKYSGTGSIAHPTPMHTFSGYLL